LKVFNLLKGYFYLNIKNSLAKILYQLFIYLYSFIIRLASPFSTKAKLWLKGRESVFERMRKIVSPDHSLVWMHCSSLGEFEQGRPLLEKIRINYPAYKILLTFFSPSGYEVRKNYEGADYIFYLPVDSSKNAKEFFEIAKPRLILFIKYEFWYYYLREAKKQDIPLLLISGIFRKSQPFFAKHGSFHRRMLSCFTHFFVQNEESFFLLKTIGFNKNVTISGDTRFDRVIEIAEQSQRIFAVEEFCYGFDVVVAGSTWPEDDKKLSDYAKTNNNVKCIIAPHNINKPRLNECLQLYKNAVLFSAINASEVSSNFNTIIIDNMGMLGSLYKYSTISYVGGGFGKEGVHNVLEAAVYGRPVIFGPVYEKFIEAKELAENGGGVSIKNYLELEAKCNEFLTKDQVYTNACKAASDYVYSKQGATKKILQFIQEKRLLTR